MVWAFLRCIYMVCVYEWFANWYDLYIFTACWFLQLTYLCGLLIGVIYSNSLSADLHTFSKTKSYDNLINLFWIFRISKYLLFNSLSSYKLSNSYGDWNFSLTFFPNHNTANFKTGFIFFFNFHSILPLFEVIIRNISEAHPDFSQYDIRSRKSNFRQWKFLWMWKFFVII